MKEKELINIIKNILNSEYIGDDCAYLKDLNIVVSQDSLVEGVHFSLSYTTAYQLGRKTVMVNISDICASGAKPKYLTISLSIPDYIDEKFVEEFYKGAKDACGDVKIVGGDITGSDKLYISATAIGSTIGRKISSRSNAKIGYKIIVSGEHGNSAKGLEILSGKLKVESEKLNNFQFSTFNFQQDISLLPDNIKLSTSKFLQSHLMPVARTDFSRQISQNCTQDYAMTDTSDGLEDALMQIAKASNVRLKIDTSKIPHDAYVDMDTVLFGGEDYELVAVVPKDLHIDGATEIGEVVDGDTGLEIDEEFYTDIDDKLFNHFKR
ncbi:thiamine-phosphate kinase [bacterium]|nr:thiamine-phosphate kinase [bacterium]